MSYIGLMNIWNMRAVGNKVIRKIFDSNTGEILTQEMVMKNEREARDFVAIDIREPGVIYVEED